MGKRHLPNTTLPPPKGERSLGLILDIREPWACPHLEAKELVSALPLGSSWSQAAGEPEGAPSSL